MNQGTKVLAWNANSPDKKVETVFLSKLDDISPSFVCIKPSAVQEYLKDKSKVTLQRFDMVEELPERASVKFKLGEYVAIDREAGRYQPKSTTISVITGINVYHGPNNIRIQYKLMSSSEYDEKQLRELTKEEVELYTPKPWTSSTI